MNAVKVKFRDLRQVLERCGFQMGNALGSHRLFLRESDDTLLFFPPLKPNDLVSDLDLIATARHLDARGIMSREEFNQALTRTNGGTRRGTARKPRARAHA